MNKQLKLQFKIFSLIFILFVIQINAQKISIYGNESKPPKYFLKEDTAKGILIEIMNYISKDINQDFEYKLQPWKRAYRNAINSKGGIIGLSKNLERLKIFDYSEVMYYDSLILVVLKGNEFEFNNIYDLKDKIVGVQRASSYGDEFEEAKKLFILI